MDRDEAFEKLRIALKSETGDTHYEQIISDAEDAFIVGDFEKMCKLLLSIKIDLA